MKMQYLENMYLVILEINYVYRYSSFFKSRSFFVLIFSMCLKAFIPSEIGQICGYFLDLTTGRL